MTATEPALLDRKAKRAQRDAERAEKHRNSKNKRKHEDIADGEEDKAGQSAGETSVQQGEKPSKADKSTTNISKKRKDRQEDVSFVVDTKGDGQLAAPTSDPPPSKKMKRTEQDGEENTPSGKKRFIVFVGNLPFSTTDDSLDKHFAKLKPYTLRHRTDPKAKKSKGFAFVEFDNYDRMKTCLKLYHHSTFDPDNPGIHAAQDEEQGGGGSIGRRKKKSKGRKINVELTAGGGGGTEARKNKIRAKNVKLEEQRTRRIQAERKEKERKSRKEGAASASVAGGGVEAKPERASIKPADAAMGEMHPSRLARLQ